MQSRSTGAASEVGKHTGASDRMTEESLLKATRADDFLSEEVVNVMHAIPPLMSEGEEPPPPSAT